MKRLKIFASLIGKQIPILLCCAFVIPCYAKKVLYFSEDQGMMWVEESQLGKVKKMKRKDLKKKSIKLQKEISTKKKRKKNHESYYKIGQRYFYDEDFVEALRYFERAYRMKHVPKYYLFIAKCHRKLQSPKRMMFVLEAIQKLYSNSDVADDALFEMALHYATVMDYHKAIEKFQILTEQYPYGKSITNNQEFREVAKQQIHILQMETSRLLTLARVGKGPLSKRIAAFQRESDLDITGKPDLITIAELMRVHEEIEEEKAQGAERRQLFAKMRKWAVLGMIFFAINFLWASSLKRKNAERKRRIEIMEKTLGEL